MKTPLFRMEEAQRFFFGLLFLIVGIFQVYLVSCRNIYIHLGFESPNLLLKLLATLFCIVPIVAGVLLLSSKKYFEAALLTVSGWITILFFINNWDMFMQLKDLDARMTLPFISRIMYFGTTACLLFICSRIHQLPGINVWHAIRLVLAGFFAVEGLNLLYTELFLAPNRSTIIQLFPEVPYTRIIALIIYGLLVAIGALFLMGKPRLTKIAGYAALAWFLGMYLGWPLHDALQDNYQTATWSLLSYNALFYLVPAYCALLVARLSHTLEKLHQE